ncbi:MAG TPA: GTPase [Gemmataceae bacterium]|nr:GTPase [Gemmataceae bacterium]
MEPLSKRALAAQLAEDFGWLEQHYRARPEQAAQLRLAAALVRNVLGPFLDGQPPAPVHVAVVGGAGAGKSTVANLLSGARAAEANPQAGFTRHPIAYTGANGPLAWSSHLGFLGPLQRLTQPTPASLDADVYQVQRVPADPVSMALLRDCVVWDCPDMTTWAATGYVPRLLEVTALADVLVYVASDERYNDEVPTQFLELLLQTGKPVVACLMKMREADAPALVAHFQQEVLGRLPPGVVATLAIPYLTPEQLADPARLAGRYRIPLVNQVAVLSRPHADARRRTVQGAMHYLSAVHERMLHAAREDMAALEGWRGLVHAGQAEFNDRYYREYLTSEKYRRFDEALVRLLELLELPGVGKLLSNVLWVLRTPYRLLREWAGKAFTRPDAPALPEQPVLEEALAGWLDLLRKEAAQHAGTHPLWDHVIDGFDRLDAAARKRFQEGFRAYQLSQTDEVEHTARAIYEELEKNPVVLNTLRGGKLAIDVAAVAGAAVTAGHLWAADIVLVPLAASLSHQLVELLGKAYVENQREQARKRQLVLMTQNISTPLAETLAEWPATGGSAYEKLQLALRRIPSAVYQLHSATAAALTPAAAG